MRYYILFFLLSLGCIFSGNLHAHSADQSYLVLRIYGDGMDGRIEMTAKDLNKALGLSLPDDLTKANLDQYIDQIKEYLSSHLDFSNEGKSYKYTFTEYMVLDLNEMEDFAQFKFYVSNIEDVPDFIDIRFDPLLDKFPNHRDLLVIEYNWKAGIVDNESMVTAIFSPNETTQTLSLKDASVWKGFVALVKLGIWHIWIGLDHILFLLALILPSVVRRQDVATGNEIQANNWLHVPKFKPAFIYIIKIVTFFTIAHSITLALAALGIINLPSRLVESIIAISIALAALHNIIPIFKRKEWLIAFLFGLFHGFGFASVLGEKGMGGDYLTLSLFGFNVGVEIGQVLIICMIFPFLFLVRKNKYYPDLLKYGSVILIIISLYWFTERAFEVDLPLGAYFWKFKEAVMG